MLTVINRQPASPGKVTLVPVAGQANTYILTRNDDPLVVGTPINKALFDQINLEISGVTDLLFTNKTVLVGAWGADATYTDYPFRASIPLDDVVSTMIPTVVTFSPDLATLGVLAPVARTYDGGLHIYALSVPSATVTVETIVLKKAPNTSIVDSQNQLVDITTGTTYRVSMIIDNGVPQFFLEEVVV